MLDCDVLLMLGTDFPYRQFYPQDSGVRIAQVDIRSENIGRRAAVDFGVVGDIKANTHCLAASLAAETRRHALGASARALRQSAQGSRRLGRPPAEGSSIPSRSRRRSVTMPQPTPSSPVTSA